MSNHVSVVGIFQNLAPQLQLYYFDIAITNANIIAIFRLYLGFGTACVVGRPGPMSPNTAQARAGRPKHSLNCASSLSCSKWSGSWGVLVGHPTECEKPFSETGVIWPWWSLTFFLALGDDFRHFFGLFPSVPIVTPKMPGVVIIKGPLTARKKIYMSPGALFWPFSAFSGNCGSRAVPLIGICGCSRYEPDIGIIGPGKKTQGV